MSKGPLSGISKLVDGRSKRHSSYDQNGGNDDFIRIPAGQTVVLADQAGAGVVTHIWCTLSCKDPLIRRNLVVRMYWDGQEHPSVEAPIGDFFGQGWAQNYNYASLPLAATPRNGNGLVCYFPMPFGNGAKITVENQSKEDVGSFYFYIDMDLRDSIPDDEGRFHAWYNQEFTKPEADPDGIEDEGFTHGVRIENRSDSNNYVFCQPEGRGHFVGVNFYINSPLAVWYGEGDDMFLVDGEPWPGSAHGTGTEDYFNQCWCPDEHFLHPYFGTARAPGRLNDSYRFGWIGRTHVYRFHFEDPIRFRKNLRASIEHGHANAFGIELSSVAYWYQTLPSAPFPPLPSAEERAPRPELNEWDLQRMRSAWRSPEEGRTWGTERD